MFVSNSPVLTGSLVHVSPNTYEIRMSQWLSKGPGTNYLFPAFLAGMVGAGALDTVYADSGEVCITILPKDCTVVKLMISYCVNTSSIYFSGEQLIFRLSC